jgi:hypothetical protein
MGLMDPLTFIVVIACKTLQYVLANVLIFLVFVVAAGRK